MMRNRIFLSVVVAVSALTCAPVVVAGQQQGTATQPEKAQSSVKQQGREVVLSVTVRDKKGALVPTLDKSDLALTQDGRPQTITSLSRESSLPFKTGLLVDTSRSVAAGLEEERKAVTQFVDTMLPEEPRAKDADQAFLIHFDRQVELLEDFTTSREKLHKELGSMSATRGWRDDGQGPETTGDDRERPARAGSNTQLYDAVFLASDELMKNQAGRKALVVFSDGVDSGSKDTLNDAVDAADRADVAVYTIYFKGQEQRENLAFPGQRRRGGIGYPGGGGGYPGGGGQPRESKPTVDGKKIMQQIAERTGGHAYEAKKREDLGPIYKLIADELHGQYLLTYTPDKPDNDGGYHKVTVKANKGDLSVVAREGYYAPGDDNK